MNLKQWLIDTIQVSKVTGINYATGQPTYGDPVTVNCRIEEEIKKVQDVNGEERISNMNIVTDQEITVDDKILLPGELEYKKPITVTAAKNKTGTVKMWTVYV